MLIDTRKNEKGKRINQLTVRFFPTQNHLLTIKDYAIASHKIFWEEINESALMSD